MRRVEHGLRGLRVLAIEERHVGAFPREQLDDRAADAAAAAGDEGGLAREARGTQSIHPEIANPPSTTSVWPLIIEASGRHRR